LLQALKGEAYDPRLAHWNWRAIFRFEDGDAHIVDCVDYHRMRNSMRMYNPPHPGEILSGLWLEPLELSITHAAEGLDVSRNMLSEIVNGRAAISPEMAMRLEIAFGKSAESWLAHQAAFDLSQVDQKRDTLHVQRLKRGRSSAE
jgi:addiction module HigA family antidote